MNLLLSYSPFAVCFCEVRLWVHCSRETTRVCCDAGDMKMTEFASLFYCNRPYLTLIYSKMMVKSMVSS